MSNNTCVLACDMGGTYIKAACVLEDGSIAGDTLMIPSRSDGPLEGVMDAWEETLSSLIAIAEKRKLVILGIGVSTPGPFDYQQKMSFMKHKFQSIYGIDLEKEIRGRVKLPDVPFQFFQDSNAYLLGEQRFGAARGIQNCTCVTLGTGLGIAVMAGGRLLSNGRDSCYIAIYRQPCGNGILEDVISGKGICAAYRELSGDKSEISAKEVGFRARQGEQAAIDVMNQFGAVLGRGVAFHLVHTWSELLVVGGQISRDLCLFEDSLIAALRKDGYTGSVRAAQFPDDAALYGVAAGILNHLNS
jgi:glucokinase